MLSPQYNPRDYEAKIYSQWEKSGAFAPAPAALAAEKKPYVIMLPPPNITGSLHMGHALQDSIMDVLVRFHRMQGEPTLWLPGLDHAAIATNKVLENQLKQEGKTRQEIGRAKFLARAKAWYDQTAIIIITQMTRLGCSCDWRRLKFTMDETYIRAVQEAFVRYYERGYIYRGRRLVNWCPRCASVISDLEIKHQEVDAPLFTLRYPVTNSREVIRVATTRPETMLGDTAVAVHPADERYRQLVGQTVRLPLTDREIPIIADERVDQSFGTGAVKVTPAHDSFDAALAETHHLPSVNVIGEDGRMTPQAGSFATLLVADARAAIVEQLRQQNILESEAVMRHTINLCDRCGTVIEPLLSRQWFVDMNKLRPETMAAVAEEKVKFYPARWKGHLQEWLTQVHDWTISRQIWLGQQIPVWWRPEMRGTEREDEPGAFIVSREKPAAAPDWEQDPDVLDTWFSSALWPFATLGWPQASSDLQQFYPTSTLVTARDILYLWVARMIFSGLELMQGEEYGQRSVALRLPFREVLIYPTVLTRQGQRMSKSLGTGVDPLDLIERHGADATRFGLLYQVSYDTQALKFDEQAVISARNFANKVWNITRLLESLPAQDKPTLADQWIVERSQMLTHRVTEYLQTYRIGEATHALYEFVWNDFADWYVEVLKVQGSTQTARQVWHQVLTLLHPFMPFITEALWQHLQQPGLLMTAPWPAGSQTASVTNAAMTHFKDIVTTVRRARALLALLPRTPIELYVEGEVPLSEVLPSLVHATLLPETNPALKVFPLPRQGTIAIGSPAITPAAVAAAREKLAQEQEDAENLLAHLQQTLRQMQTKAPPERVAAKQTERERALHHLAELKRSRSLLQ